VTKKHLCLPCGLVYALLTMRKILIPTLLLASLIVGGASLPGTAQAKETPIGPHVIQNGIEVGAVYLQPIEMDPPDMMRAAAQSDIHLEADIHAAKDNRNGFAEGDWVPALAVSFEITKLEGEAATGPKVSGMLMPMVANDGPHYGDNVKLSGPGRYRLKLTVAPPGANSHFGRHVDKETGVAEWFKPFDLIQDFTFAGIGKKGAY
jgi:periplasmic iron binding protein